MCMGCLCLLGIRRVMDPYVIMLSEFLSSCIFSQIVGMLTELMV